MGKKRPTLKGTVQRGYATTSTPKKVQDPPPAGAAVKKQASKTPTSAAATDYDKVNDESLADRFSASKATAIDGERADADFFDPEKEEEQALQNLVDKLQDRIDKETSRQHKAIEYDRRFAKTLTNFEMDPEIRDQVLQVAADLNKQSAAASSNTNANGAIGSKEASAAATEPLAIPTTTVSGATTVSGSATPVSVGSSHTSLAMATLTKDLQKLSVNNGASSSSSSSVWIESEEKIMAKALTTYQILLKLGFSSAQVEDALANAPAPDFEDCLSYLYLALDEEALEDAIRAGEGKAAKNRRQKDINKKDFPSLNGASDDKEEEDNDDDYDESRPPVYKGYEFTRSETLGKNDFARVEPTAATKSVPGAASSGMAPTSTAASSATRASTLATKNSIGPGKVELLRKSSERLIKHLDDDLESNQIDTLEKPTATWSLLRAMQIRIDQERSKWKKELGKEEKSQMKQEDARLERVLGRTKDFMRECERGAYFDQKTATDGFRQVLRQREEIEKQLKAAEEEEEKKRLQRRQEIEAAAGIKSSSAEEVNSNPKPKAADKALSPAEAADEKKDDESAANKEQDNEEDKNSDLGSDDEGGMFGDLLNEGPIEDQDADTGMIVTMRVLPARAKSGGGGKTPRVMLSDALKRADPYSTFKFTAILSGGRMHRSKLDIRWNGGKVVPNKNPVTAGTPTYVDEYTLTTVGCASQLQADDFIATVALFCIDRDKSVQRALPPGYREWWEELAGLQKDERDRKSRTRFQRVRDVVRVRMEEASAAKKAKSNIVPAAAVPEQTELGELSSASAPQPSEARRKEIANYFSNRVASSSYQKMLPGRQGLPIANHRQEILDLVEDNQIFVLSGETGCGKSTQVPAYILEHCMSQGRNCKIYVTEPRRISAISLAERVSEELGEPRKSVGSNDSLVGYAIRLESNVGKNARLVYATTGIVLRMLEGTAFNEITHVIIDEVHERSIESDFLLIILKTLIAHRKDLKVILMSATVDAERISKYCGGCPTISVPGRTFPVNVHYLEDAVEMSNYVIEDDSPYAFRPKRGYRDGNNARKQNAPGNKSKLQILAQAPTPEEDDDDALLSSDEENPSAPGSLSKSYQRKTVETLTRMNEYVINHDLIIRILERICLEPDLQPYSAATLIFMPGLAEIRKCHDMLVDHPTFGGTGFQLFPLHSTISSENQGAVFNVPPEGVRKIVIATNIAETGITIPDITCVIDSGKHREMRYDEKRQISRLVECFIARSNAKQRRGRAGRVQEGICFHLFTKFRHDSYLDEHPLPEMLRLSLQDLALKLKIMKIKIGTSIENALSQALDPPSAANVQRAIAALVEVKALTTTEEITHLGRHLSKMPLDVHMGKFLLIATLFKCLDPALTIAAALNSKSPFMVPFGKELEADRAKQSFKLGDSDFLTIANAFNGFRRSAAQNHHRTFCNRSFLSIQNLLQIEELRQQYFSYLIDASFVTVDDTFKAELNKLRYRSGGSANFSKPKFMTIPSHLDENSSSLSMIHASLATGLYPKLLHIDAKTYQLKTITNNQPTSIHPSSVNFRSKMSELIRSSSSYMLYYTMMQSKKLYAWETGLMDDKVVYLLCGEGEFRLAANSLYIDRMRVRIASGDPKTLVALKTLREGMSKLLRSAWRNPGKEWSEGQVRLFELMKGVLGVGANEKDLALLQ
ncbi:probable DNA/RNA helicase (DEAD/H box family II) [Melanopsichium pennsylvanicum]|uniref:RNA helicase n=2 Tax=Melanopsichium pennsylvanicum TaxID=63383 RepID=A0AAJ4XGZ9_9BASI|nr:probable DNA/RNA helicase (DEAD/H box family II) [Melanopsichium pennsylvanicum 4]SNX81910.1 probable DNA/RNA helicase (DEAD/H box family II) [Melanopsichium pennsylvanicum]